MEQSGRGPPLHSTYRPKTESAANAQGQKVFVSTFGDTAGET